MTFETLENCVRGVILGGSIPFARVTENNNKLILQALDTGVMGIMVPQVATVEEVHKCVQAVRYAPEGVRSLSFSTRAARYRTRPMSTHMKMSKEQIMLILQLESKQACDNLEELLAIEGVDAYFLGPADLSQSIGVPGQTEHPMVQDLLKYAIQKCRSAGMPIGTTASTPQQLASLKEVGAQIFTPVFQSLLSNASRAFLTESQQLVDN